MRVHISEIKNGLSIDLTEACCTKSTLTPGEHQSGSCVEDTISLVYIVPAAASGRQDNGPKLPQCGLEMLPVTLLRWVLAFLIVRRNPSLKMGRGCQDCSDLVFSLPLPNRAC